MSSFPRFDLFHYFSLFACIFHPLSSFPRFDLSLYQTCHHLLVSFIHFLPFLGLTFLITKLSGCHPLQHPFYPLYFFFLNIFHFICNHIHIFFPKITQGICHQFYFFKFVQKISLKKTHIKDHVQLLFFGVKFCRNVKI